MSSSPAFAETRPRSILVFVQSDPRGPFHQEMFSGLRAVVDETHEPLSIYLEYLDRSRFTAPGYDEELRGYIETKYRDRPIGVVVGFGTSTIEFIAPMWTTVFSGVPLVFGQVDEASYRRLQFPPKTTGHYVRLEPSDMIDVARAVVPGLKRVAVAGNPLETQTVFRHFKDELPRAAKELEIIDLTGLPMDELQHRVASLPDATAILYTAIYSDGRGTYLPPVEALKLFAGKANRPIVIAIETNLGIGPVGGYLMKAGPIGTAAGRAALRIINGEDAASIPIAKGNVSQPIFDWRQLERWGIKESALPKGSEIRFRPPPTKIPYVDIVLYAAGGVLVGGIIGLSLYEHRKRRSAEDDARARISELALVNRQATAGEMSAAIAHELNQPLGAILNDAEAAELILKSDQPNLADLKELVADIRRSDRRASDIIRQVRALLSKTTTNFRVLDLNRTAHQAIEIAKIQADASKVTVHVALNGERLPVVGDTVQLQQVFLNLIMNGIDAVRDRPSGFRDVVISTSYAKGDVAEVSVSDSGFGISDDNIKRVFEPFFSTKEKGMGVGLSLCRTIIEAHNGSISAANGSAGGAIFRFRLPLSQKGVRS